MPLLREKSLLKVVVEAGFFLVLYRTLWYMYRVGEVIHNGIVLGRGRWGPHDKVRESWKGAHKD